MKKLTLLTALAVCGMGAANAQYVTNEPGIANTNGETYWVFQLDAATVEGLQTSGKTVYDYSLDNVSRNLYIWDNTFVAGDGSYPGVDMQMDGYTALEVGSVGWSGAGFNVAGDGVDLRDVTDDTHVHIGVRCNNAPTSIGFVLFNGYTWETQELCSAGTDGDANSTQCTPANISIGSEAFNDNGTIYSLVGDVDRAGGDWVAIDITMGDLKRLCSTFNFTPGFFKGNTYAVLAGGVTGTDVCIDAVYLYGEKSTSAVNEIAVADDVQIMVTDKTISALGNDNAGIEVYNISGQMVKRSSTSIVGCEDLADGVYVVKAGNTVKKVVLK